MGIIRASLPVKDGLVFGYDTGYPVSTNSTKTVHNQGEPLSNLWDSMLNTQSLRTHTKHYWNGKNWVINSTYSDPGVPGPKGTYLGIVFKHVSGALNSTWSGNSYGYMLRDIACTNGATMTQSCWIFVSSDCNVTSIPSVIEGESGGESTVSGFPSSYDLNNKGTWQITAKKAISDGNTRFIPLYPRRNGVTDGSFSGFFMWGLPQVTYGDHVVQPLLPGTTRTSTESLIDITRNNDINLSNVSFDSNAQMTFDGTDDYIQLDVNLSDIVGSTPSAITFEFVAKADNLTNLIGISGDYTDPSGTGFGIKRSSSNNKLEFRVYATGGIPRSTTDIPTNSYFYGACVWDGTGSGEHRIYFNGILETTDTSAGTTWNHGNGDLRIGDIYNSMGTPGEWQGEIPVFRIYNRVLTAEEIQQNFNAYSKRFNI